MPTIKKLMLGLLFAALLATGVAKADSVNFQRFFTLSGTALQPLNSAWTLGSSATRIAKGWFTDIDTTTITISGVLAQDVAITKADPSVIYNVITAGDTDFWTGVQDDAGGTDNDQFQIGKGMIPGTTPYLTLDKDGNAGISTTTPAGRLDVAYGGIGTGGNTSAIIIGADLNTTSRTNTTRKLGFITEYHYTNTEEALGIIGADANSTTNTISIGGGSSGLNAATEIDFYTAANSTTTGGTARMVIDTSGNVGIGIISPSYRLDIQQPTSDAVFGLSLRGYTTGIDGARTFNVKTVSSNDGNWANLSLSAYNFNFITNGSQTTILTNDGKFGLGTTSPSSTLHVVGSQTVKRTATATDYTVLTTDYYVGVTSTAVARTITLPAAATAAVGKVYIIKDESGGAGTNNITVDGNGAETIDGAATKAINSNYGSYSLITNGSNWFIF